MTLLTTDTEPPEERGSSSGTFPKLIARVFGSGAGGEMARGAVTAFLITSLGTLIAFIVQVLLARAAGPHEYGIYALTLSAMNIAMLLAKLDLDGAALRFLGEYRARQQWSLFRGFLELSGRVVAMAALVVGLVAAALILVLGGNLPRSTRNAYLLGCALLPIASLLQLSASQLRGLREVMRAQIPPMLLRPVLLGAGVLLVGYVLDAGLNAPRALGLNILAASVALVTSYRLLAGVLPGEVAAVAPTYDVATWRSVAFGFLLISASQLVLSQQADVVIVGALLDPAAAGHYGAASQLAMLLQFGSSAVFFVATPMMAELHARESRADLQRLITVVDRATLAISLPILILLGVGGRMLLGLYGPTFQAAYPVLLILMVSQTITAVVGAGAGFLLSMTGRQHTAAAIIGSSALLNIVLAFALTPRFGVVGTASATAISTLVRGVALVTVIRSKLGINATPLAMLRIRRSPSV